MVKIPVNTLINLVEKQNKTKEDEIQTNLISVVLCWMS